MREDYLISVVGQQIVNNNDNEIALTALGSFDYSRKKTVIKYYEYNGNESSSKTESILEVEGNNLVTLTKNGVLKSQLILEKGKRHLCQYPTEYGYMIVGIFTKHIQTNFSKKGGFIDAEYTLDINSSVTSLNKIHVKVEEAKHKCQN